MPVMQNGLFSVRRAEGCLTRQNFLRTKKKLEAGPAQAGSRVKNTRPGLMPVGLAGNILKQLIILSGRNKTGYTIQPLKMWNSFPG